MKWWKQIDRVAMLDRLVSGKGWSETVWSSGEPAELDSFSCSSGCADVGIWLIDVSSGNTYWIPIMNALALPTPASPRNWDSHHLTNVCPVFNCFPAPLEKTREDFWCAWRLESHLSWLAVTSHGDGGFQAAFSGAALLYSDTRVKCWDWTNRKKKKKTRTKKDTILRAFSCRLIINSGQTVHNFKGLDVLEVFWECFTFVRGQFGLNDGNQQKQ